MKMTFIVSEIGTPDEIYSYRPGKNSFYAGNKSTGENINYE
jgi:hypothetical protein